MVKKNKTFDDTSTPQMSSTLVILQQTESDWDSDSVCCKITNVEDI